VEDRGCLRARLRALPLRSAEVAGPRGVPGDMLLWAQVPEVFEDVEGALVPAVLLSECEAGDGVELVSVVHVPQGALGHERTRARIAAVGAEGSAETPVGAPAEASGGGALDGGGAKETAGDRGKGGGSDGAEEGEGQEAGEDDSGDVLQSGALVPAMQAAAALCDAMLAFLDFVAVSSKVSLWPTRRQLLIAAHRLEQAGSDERAELCRWRALEVGDTIAGAFKARGEEVLLEAAEAAESEDITTSFKLFDEAVRLFNKVEEAGLAKAAQRQRAEASSRRDVAARNGARQIQLARTRCKVT
jgi:hypothetical protein